MHSLTEKTSNIIKTKRQKKKTNKVTYESILSSSSENDSERRKNKKIFFTRLMHRVGIFFYTRFRERENFSCPKRDNYRSFFFVFFETKSREIEKRSNTYRDFLPESV